MPPVSSEELTARPSAETNFPFSFWPVGRRNRKTWLSTWLKFSPIRAALLHIHSFDQFYYVLDGTMSVDVGLNKYQAGPHTRCASAGVVHQNRNSGAGVETHITILAPHPTDGMPLDTPVEIRASQRLRTYLDERAFRPMRAMRADKFGGPEELKLVEHAEPKPAAGQVRIRVHSAGINPANLVRLSAMFPGLALPYIPGTDVSGEIDALGEGVDASRFRRARLRPCYHRRLCGKDLSLGERSDTPSLRQPVVCRRRRNSNSVFYRLPALYNKASLRPGESVLISGGGEGWAWPPFSWPSWPERA